MADEKPTPPPVGGGRSGPQGGRWERPGGTGKKGEPVAIGRLERFVADFERVTGNVVVPEVAPPTGKRVAVVGAGPAGLTGAGGRVQMGHEVPLFGGLHQPGGGRR